MAKKLKELKQIDGKQESIVPTTLEQIFGSTGEEKYGTLDQTAYESELTEMNKTDLYREAVKRGLMPTDHRQQLEKKLIKAFVEHKNAFTFRPAPVPDKKLSKEALKILAEGRS